MTQNMKLTDGEFQVSLAPWVQQFMEARTTYTVVSENVIQEKLKAGVKDPAQYIGSVQVDDTGKFYKKIITISGKNIRIAVKPENDPDEPLYTQVEINLMGNYLLNRKGHKIKKLRDYAYFVFTINTWRRAGDNLELVISDVMNQDGTIKNWLLIKNEQKTGKKTSTPINSAVQKVLKEYLDARKEYELTDYLFPSNFKNNTMMTVDGMCLVLKRAAKAIGLTQKIGTHSLRKTGAYHYVMQAEDKSEAEREVSQIFGHSSIQITRHYLTLEQKQIQQNFEDRRLEVVLRDTV